MRSFRRICFLFLSLSALSTFVQSQWVQTSSGLTNPYVHALAIRGTDLFAGTDQGGIFRSTDNGTSWIAANSGVTNTSVWCLAASGTNLFAGTVGGGVFCSTDRGASWAAVNTGLTRTSVIYALAVIGNCIISGPESGGVYRSTNNGASWIFVDSGLTTTNRYGGSADALSFAVSDTNLFAGVNGAGVFLSTDSGISWTSVSSGLTDIWLHGLAISGTVLLAGTESGVFRSTDNGMSWVPSGLRRVAVSFCVTGTNVFAGTPGDGVFLSNDGGISWTPVSSGLTYPEVLALAVSGPYLYAGTGMAGVWRRPLSEMTSVEERSSDLPASYSLSQNYPNPFNPSTIIRYTMPHRSHVTLTVFNMLGQLVTTLVNGEVEAGYHEVQFNCSGLASGVYFYRLNAGAFVQTRKLCVLK